MADATAAAFGLFGREAELRALSTALTEGGSVVVTGDPGSGKSSLLHVIDQLAQRNGRRVLSVAPTLFDRELPFAGLAELIAQCPPGTDSALPAPQQHALSVAMRRVQPDGPEVDALAVPLAVRGLLLQLCTAEPVVLILDDLQWLDRESTGSLAFALRRISVDPSRLAVLVGSRPDMGDGRDLVRALPEPRREVTLEPLEDWAIGQLLRARLGHRWTPPISAGIAKASGGNPFLALMIAQAMQSDMSKWRWSDSEDRDPVFPVPPSLVDILGEKVTLLPPAAREVLLLVAAAGRLSVAQLDDLVEVGKVRAALEAAADWEVAIVGAGSVVAFTHPMLASAIYDAATPAERRAAHRALADHLDDPVERARHRAKTITAPDERVAAELEGAAEVSRHRGAQHLAAELWEAAALASPEGSASVPSRWLRAGEGFLGAGDNDAARDAFDRAARLATTPEQRAEVLSQQAWLSDQRTGIRTRLEEVLPLTKEGAVRADLLTSLGTAYRMEGHRDEALRITRAAVTEAAGASRPDLQLAALNEQLAIEQHWGDQRASQTLGDISDLIERSGPELPTSLVAWSRSFFAPWDDDRSEHEVREGIRLAVEAGRYGDLANLYISLVLVLIRASRVQEAREALEESDRLGAWAASSLQEDMARVLVSEYAGDLAAARSLAEHGIEQSRAMSSTYWLAGFVAQSGFTEVSARSWTAALDALREVAEIFRSTGMVDLEQLLWGVDYADAALQVGALDEVEEAIGFLRRQGEAWRPEATVAARRCQALLTAARGDVDTALHELVAVVDADGVESPFEAARSHLALGQVYRRAGYKGMANETLLLAARSFEMLGTPCWAERARDEANRVGLHRSGLTLTETEGRVADLVSAGRSNQEVAAELFMSVKTVEANLTRIYRKVGVRTRTELANRLRQGNGVREASDVDSAG